MLAFFIAHSFLCLEQKTASAQFPTLSIATQWATPIMY
jgi:hypothetical protein